MNEQKNIFIDTEPLGLAGETGERLVWEKVKSAYTGKDCLGYLKYPLFPKGKDFRYEPDILLLDREYGAIIIEVKGIQIEQLVTINGHQWEHQHFYTATSRPYEQAEAQMRALLAIFNQHHRTKNNVHAKVLIALPYITTEQWREKGFDRIDNLPPILFADRMGKGPLLQAIQQARALQKGQEPMSDELFEVMKALLSGTQNFRQKLTESYAKTGTRLSLIQELDNRLKTLDYQQEKLAKVIPPGPQRIRGIAGSGKTVILCQKAAQMYLKNPQKKIVITCFSTSLLHELEENVDKWLTFFDEDVCYDDEVKKNLMIMHAWGNKKRPGFYSSICHAHGYVPKGVQFINDKNAEIDRENKRIKAYNDTIDDPKKHVPLLRKIESQGDTIGYLCRDFLENVDDVKPLFDAVLIDEGQDLLVNKEFTYEGKQPFYWLAYETLHAIPDEEVNKRLIWAYDESQSLDNLQIPTAKELFGDDDRFSRFVSGYHKGGMRKSEIMQKCYRTPGPILTAAHAIGMGLLREDGMLRGLTTQEDWRNIGYQVKQGNFRTGETITLYRPKENSPNLIPSYWKEDVFNFTTYSSKQAELDALVTQLQKNRDEDCLHLDRQILIVALKGKYQIQDIARALEKANIDYYVAAKSKKNTTEGSDTQKEKFWEQGAVTISTVHRAKGNEADVVYVLGAEFIAKQEANVTLRNQLFVALTRTRGWVNLSGITLAGTEGFYAEISSVLASGESFTFEYKRAQQMQVINEAPDFEEFSYLNSSQ